MYQNFIVSTQQVLCLLLEYNDDIVEVLKFKFSQYKYGYPNDEVGHPYMRYGLGLYGFYEVKNSPWIVELKGQNKKHPSHDDRFYKDRKHYIVRFKDVTLEVVTTSYEELKMTRSDINDILVSELNNLIP
jgi:hypothetical protein